MNLFYIIICFVFVIVALFGTISVGKIVNQTIRAEKNKDYSPQVEKLTSSPYKKKSATLLASIYAVTFILSIIAMAVVLLNV